MHMVAKGLRIAAHDDSLERFCDLCDGAGFEVVSELDRDGRPLQTVVCTDCGLVAHAEIPSDADLDAFYTNDYRRAYHGEVTPSDKRVMRAWQIGERILGDLKPYLRRSDAVFEVGCGLGATLKAFELADYDASGIEPNADFCKYGAQTLQARAWQASLFDLPAYPRFDVVLLVHVIEHFRSPRRALEFIHRMLLPGGRLYVECPNLAAPFALKQRMFHFAHIHNFTPTTLIAMARRCGFDVLHNFHGNDDPNLQMLLVRTNKKTDPVDSRGYSEAIAAMNRYNLLTYHLRWDYTRCRLSKLKNYLHEYLVAQSFVQQRVEQCQQAVRSRSEWPEMMRAAA